MTSVTPTRGPAPSRSSDQETPTATDTATPSAPSETPEARFAFAGSWIARASLLLIFVTLSFGIAKGYVNNDVWFHLRFGHEFLSGWSPWDPGSLSPQGTADWFPTQWLSQVALGQLEAWGGVNAVVIWGGVWALAYALVLYVVCRRLAGPWVAVGLTLLTVVVCAGWLSARPQVISYVFVVLVMAAWTSTYRDGRLRWWLLPLFWVWPMFHGMWPFGMVLSAVALAGLALDRTISRRVTWQGTGLLVGAFCLTFLTPVGPRLVAAVLVVTDRSQYFAEWKPPTFSDPRMLVTVAPLALIVILLARRDKASWFHILLTLTATGIAVYATRMAPLALAVGSVLLCHVLSTRQLDPPTLVRARRRLDLRLALAGFLASVGILVATAPTVEVRLSDDLTWASPTLDQLPPHSTVLTDRPNGAWLLYSRPELNIPVHGYMDLMTDSEIKKVYRLETGDAGWEETLTWLAPAAAVLARDSTMEYNLRRVLGWKIVAQHEKQVVLLPPPTQGRGPLEPSTRASR